MKDPLAINNDLDLLHPSFRAKVEAILENANRQAFGADGRPKFANFARFGVFEGYRSPERQLALYAIGRTKQRGKAKVTNSRVSNYHSVGLAVDIVWFDTHGRPQWSTPNRWAGVNDTRTVWQILGHCARAEECVWGGDWDMRDMVHIQCNADDREDWLEASRKRLRAMGWNTA